MVAASPPPQPPSATNDADQLRAADIGQRLDALLRAAPGDVASAADVLARWRRLPEAWCALQGLELRVGDALVGEAGGALDGRWWLLAQAGVASLRPLPTCTPGELLGCLASVAALAPGEAALRELRRSWCDAPPAGMAWLWTLPAWETPLALQATLPSREQVQGRRARGSAALVDGWKHAAGDPLAPAPAAAPGALAMGVADAAFWLESVAHLLDRDEPLRAEASPQLWAAQVPAWTREGPSLRLGPVLAALHRTNGPFSGPWLRAMTPRTLGREVARRVRVDAATLPGLDQALAGGDGWAGGVASGLLERGREDERSLALLHGLVQRYGLERLWEIASLDGIEDKPARSLARLLKSSNAPPNMWADLVAGAPPRVAAWIIASAPSSLFARLGAALRRGLRERPAAEAAPLLETLLQSGHAEAVRVVAEVLVESRARDWPAKLVPEVLTAAVQHGLATPLLLPLFLDRGADTRLRLLVLRALGADAAALDEAIKFRVTEVMEPKEIQERLKAARKARRGE